MSTNSIYDNSSLIDKQEVLAMKIAKAKAILELLLTVNLKEYPTLSLYFCLEALDDLLDEADKYTH